MVALFSWQGMKSAVKAFTTSCQVFQQAKPERVLRPGILQPLPIPFVPWEMAMMDFIDG
jgi:hypothetical protein